MAQVVLGWEVREVFDCCTLYFVWVEEGWINHYDGYNGTIEDFFEVVWMWCVSVVQDRSDSRVLPCVSHDPGSDAADRF